jgi:hypothetical protein
MSSEEKRQQKMRPIYYAGVILIRKVEMSDVQEAGGTG